MQFYVQIDKDGCVRDCIEYQHAGYMPVELETPLPNGFLGGWYHMVDGKPVFDRELYEQINEIPRLKQELEDARANAGGDSEAEIDAMLDYLEGKVSDDALDV